MPLFIKINDTDRSQLFNSIKEQHNSSWSSFYPKINISRSSFFNYLSGRYPIPKEIFLKLEDKSKFKVKDYEEVNCARFLKKTIRVPPLDSSLAEIMGILNGDGHISKSKYEICVVGNLNEEDYFNHIQNLFENTFKLNSKIYKLEHCIKLRMYSKELFDLLVRKYNLPKGNKMGQLTIPKQVLDSDRLLSPYIRGLFDTDGSFYIRRKKDPVLEISSADASFLVEIKEALCRLGFRTAKGKNRVFIYDKPSINLFFKIIKPSNTKHLKKYQNYLNLISAGDLKA